MVREIRLEGTLPSGARDSETIRVAGIVPFLSMKGMALAERLKEKDAYDVYFCVKNYPDGIDALVAEFEPHVSHGLVKEGLIKLAGKFTSPDAFGPTAIADFERVTDPEYRDLLRRDAYEQIAALLDRLGISGSDS